MNPVTPQLEAKVAETKAALRRLAIDRGCAPAALDYLIQWLEVVSDQAGPDGRADLRAFFVAFCDSLDAGAETLTAEDLATCRVNRARSKVVA